jgi:FMN-dependent oxidoreductase (nitrilotriacetate monooxygenase family)
MSPSRIHLSGFIQCCPDHQIKGMWKHPLDQSSQGYRRLSWWQDLARLLERGCFDALFFADVLGTYDVYGGGREAAIRHAVQFPGNDPTLLISGLASVTEHLGFGVTYSTSHFPPFHTARVFSTLDHLTDGRIGWNIVTSYLADAERQGLGRALPHDERYDRADEYMDVLYQLWEGSWEDDAVVLDVERDVHTDPSKVHTIDHHGRWFDVEGPHLCEPSPQRTPVLFQAGSSGRGLDFAAQHGEVLFVALPGGAAGRAVVEDVRARAEARGRAPEHLRILQGARMVVAETDAEAGRMREQWRRNFSVEGYLSLYGGWTGIDLGGHPPDTPIDQIPVEGMRSMVDRWRREDPSRTWTVADVAQRLAETGGGRGFVGSPHTVADQLEDFAEATGVDGFNLITSPVPWGLERVVELLVPELRRRGRYRARYEEATLRERFLGVGQTRLPDDHPGARRRRTPSSAR